MAVFEYLKALRRRWGVVLACFLVAMVAGFIMSPDAPAEPEGAGYQASLTLIPSTDVTTGVNLHLAAHMATGPDVAELAADNLPAGVNRAGVGAISASVSSEVGSLIITATDRDALRAGLLAEAYAEATIEFLVSTTAQSHDEALAAAEGELQNIEANIAELQGELRESPGDEVLQAQLNTELTRYGIVFHRVQDLLGADEPPQPLQVLGTATVTPVDPGGITAPTDRRVRALLAGGLGLVLGLALALTIDRLDTRMREREEVEEAFGLPILAEIPRISRRGRVDHAVVTVLRPDSAVAEAYRTLRSAITLVTHGSRAAERAESTPQHEPPQVLVVTGSRGDEGKSTTVANLAAAMAETGRSVLVIDCDFRKPEAHKYLDPKPRSGLANLSIGGFGEYLDQVVRSTSVRGVELVTSLKPVSHPATVVSRLSGLIADARNKADVVLIDSSPLLATSDAQDVLQYADAALVTCRVGRTKYGEATRARRILQRADVPLLGVVLTGTAPHHGTPYGQPSRKEVVWSHITHWARNPGPDSDRPNSDPSNNGSSSRPDDSSVAPDRDDASTSAASPDPAPEVSPDRPVAEVPGTVHSEWDDTVEFKPPTHSASASVGQSTAGRRRRGTPE
jgi:capsular exopolysaccharide synthesis family protein